MFQYRTTDAERQNQMALIELIGNDQNIYRWEILEDGRGREEFTTVKSIVREIHRQISLLDQPNTFYSVRLQIQGEHILEFYLSVMLPGSPFASVKFHGWCYSYEFNFKGVSFHQQISYPLKMGRIT